VDAALEGPFHVLDDVEERAPVELHLSEVLEQDVDRIDGGTPELLPGQSGPMHSGELVELLTHDDAQVLEAHPVDTLVGGMSSMRETGVPARTSSGSASTIKEIGT
jgi:hypothetical protein